METDGLKGYNIYKKYNDLEVMYKMELPIKVKRNEFTRTVNKRIEHEANNYYQQEVKEIKKLTDLNKYERNIKKRKVHRRT